MKFHLLQKRGLGQIASVSIALFIMIIIFSIINKSFFSSQNTLNLLRQIVPILLIGIGQSYVLITAGIDLSIGSVAGMSSMISATLMTRTNLPLSIIIILTLLSATTIGLINGFLIAKPKIPPFIATLGTMIVARGIAQLVNGNYNTNGIPERFEGFKDFFYYGEVGGVYTVILLALFVFLIFNFILNQTKLGRYIYALGSNYEATRLAGVNVIQTEVMVYVISSFLAGLVGLILTAQSGLGTMNAGLSYELNAVAASVIGGVSTMGGQGLLLGTVLGSFIWGVLNNGLQFAGAPLALRNLVIGIVVVISVLIDRLARNYTVRKMFLSKVKKILKPTKKEDSTNTV